MKAQPLRASTYAHMCGRISTQLALLSPASWQQVSVRMQACQHRSITGASCSSISAYRPSTVTRRTGCGDRPVSEPPGGVWTFLEPAVHLEHLRVEVDEVAPLRRH
jgi:hypothetical protein